MLCVHAPTPWVASIGYLYHARKISAEGATYAFYATREPYLIQAFQRGQVFLDGDCKNLPITLEIAELIPNAKFIHLVRRPENFIKSGLARGYYKTTPPELWGHLTEQEFDVDQTISLESQIENIAFFWNEANRIAEKAKDRLGDGRVATIVAERMFDHPAAIINALEQLSLNHVVEACSKYSIRRLNRQGNIDHSSETENLIENVVARVCDTRALYYG